MLSVVHDLEIAPCHHLLLRQLASYPLERLLARYAVARHYAAYAQLYGRRDAHHEVERHTLVETAVP